jgi:hypothetical protein
MIPLNTLFSNVNRTETTHAPVNLVFIDPSNTMYTYSLHGSKVIFLGKGDLHDRRYNAYKRKYTIRTDYHGSSDSRDDNNTNNGTRSSSPTNSCTILLYPTHEEEAFFESSSPIAFAGSIIGKVGFTLLFFAVYNMIIQRQQNKLISSLQIISKVVLSEVTIDANNDDNNNNNGINRFKATFTGRTERGKLQNFLTCTYYARIEGSDICTP